MSLLTDSVLIMLSVFCVIGSRGNGTNEFSGCKRRNKITESSVAQQVSTVYINSIVMKGMLGLTWFEWEVAGTSLGEIKPVL